MPSSLPKPGQGRWLGATSAGWGSSPPNLRRLARLLWGRVVSRACAEYPFAPTVENPPPASQNAHVPRPHPVEPFPEDSAVGVDADEDIALITRPSNFPPRSDGNQRSWGVHCRAGRVVARRSAQDVLHLRQTPPDLDPVEGRLRDRGRAKRQREHRAEGQERDR